MERLKLIEFLNWYGRNVDTDIASVEVENEADYAVTINNEATYIILTEKEANERFAEQQRALIEDGLNSFAEWARKEILENYIDMDSLNEIIEEEGEDCFGYKSGYEYLANEFGIDYLSEFVENHNLLLIDEVIEFVKLTDGRGATLALYDGEEHELNGYDLLNRSEFEDPYLYIYRID